MFKAWQNQNALEFSSDLSEAMKNVVRSAGAPNANTYERWERRYSYDALNRAIGSSTKIQVANQPQLTLNQQSYFDKSYGRPKQMLYPQSAIDQQPVSTYLAYNSVGALVVADFRLGINGEDKSSRRKARCLRADFR